MKNKVHFAALPAALPVLTALACSNAPQAEPAGAEPSTTVVEPSSAHPEGTLTSPAPATSAVTSSSPVPTSSPGVDPPATSSSALQTSDAPDTSGANPDVSSSGSDPSSLGGLTTEPSSVPLDVECNASTAVGTRARGTGPYEVVVEVNTDPGIAEGTIFRPADLDGTAAFPIFVWGQGGCSRNGMSNAAAMTEIASHGYFVVADGTPQGSGNRTMDRAQLDAMGAPLLAYVDWAIAENAKPCSAYYRSLDVTKVAANGFSCGGLMAQGAMLDERIVTWGVTSSGMAGATQEFYDAIHTPVLFVEGGMDDVAYDGALQGYQEIEQLGVPVMWFDTARGHGGDLLESDGGDFTKINLAWLNWWLKGDESETGKGMLTGDTCPYCSDPAWDVRSANLP